jgi:hypothetical protein
MLGCFFANSKNLRFSVVVIVCILSLDQPLASLRPPPIQLIKPPRKLGIRPADLVYHLFRPSKVFPLPIDSLAP